MEHKKIWDEVEFFSNGIKLAAYLYRPKEWKPDDNPRPGIVMLHGYNR